MSLQHGSLNIAYLAILCPKYQLLNIKFLFIKIVNSQSLCLWPNRSHIDIQYTPILTHAILLKYSSLHRSTLCSHCTQRGIIAFVPLSYEVVPTHRVS